VCVCVCVCVLVRHYNITNLLNVKENLTKDIISIVVLFMRVMKCAIHVTLVEES